MVLLQEKRDFGHEYNRYLCKTNSVMSTILPTVFVFPIQPEKKAKPDLSVKIPSAPAAEPVPSATELLKDVTARGINSECVVCMEHTVSQVFVYVCLCVFACVSVHACTHV